MSAYFVTAIGTDVGKTFATAALLYAARAQGKSVAGYKPLACGSEHALGGDVAEIIAAAGMEHTQASPWWFAAPLSPHMAAAAEGKTIDPDAVVQWCRARAAGRDLVLIEGVGGVMVPITPTYTVRDWMQALALPVILVASNYLGAINHSLLTIEVLRQASIPIAAIIVSESVGGVSLSQTEATIRTFAPEVPLIVSQPRVASWKEAQAIHALAAHL